MISSWRELIQPAIQGDREPHSRGTHHGDMVARLVIHWACDEQRQAAEDASRFQMDAFDTRRQTMCVRRALRPSAAARDRSSGLASAPSGACSRGLVELLRNHTRVVKLHAQSPDLGLGPANHCRA